MRRDDQAGLGVDAVLEVFLAEHFGTAAVVGELAAGRGMTVEG